MIPLEALRSFPQAYVQERLHARIADDERRGAERGGATEYRLWAELNRKVVSEHQPSAPSDLAPCTSCGEPWPCPTVHGVLADD